MNKFEPVVDVDLYLFKKPCRVLVQNLIKEKKPFMVWSDLAIPFDMYKDREDYYALRNTRLFGNKATSSKGVLAVVKFSDAQNDEERIRYMEELVAFINQ